MQASILRVKLKHLDEWNELRRRRASLYTQRLSQIDGIEPPYIEEHNKPSGNYYTIRLKDSRLNRDELQKHLAAKGIQTAVYYPLSLHLQEAYKSSGYKPGDFPQSEQAQEQVLSLPMYPELSQRQIEEVASAISDYCSRGKPAA